MSSPELSKILEIPEGYQIRPTRIEDVEASVKLWEIISSHMGVPEFLNVEEERSNWLQPNFNLSDSSIVLEDSQENFIGTATVWDNSELPVRPWLSWDLHPAHEGKGLEEFLIQWLENKAVRVLERCPQEAKVTLMTGAYFYYEPRKKTLEALGYTHYRNFYRMKTILTEAPQLAPLAEGFSIRPMNYPQEFEAAIKARTIAFRDHYGFVQESHEETLREWQYEIDNDKLFDPSLYFLAIEDATGEIAGICWGRMEEHGEPENAYVSQVAVLPAYRKKGLAHCLLLHTFNEFWQRGRKTITLYVDASSLTGATRVYEKVGMSPDRIWASYGKLLRDGIDFSTVSLNTD